MKTNELTGAALDWAVAACESWKTVYVNGALMLRHYHPDAAHTPHCYVEDFCYSSDWSQGGPIIEREGIAIGKSWEGWKAFTETSGGEGPSPLIAAMRCYVASKLGDDINIPEELL